MSPNSAEIIRISLQHTSPIQTAFSADGAVSLHKGIKSAQQTLQVPNDFRIWILTDEGIEYDILHPLEILRNPIVCEIAAYVLQNIPSAELGAFFFPTATVAFLVYWRSLLPFSMSVSSPEVPSWKW